MKELVSIIIPTFNRANLISYTLDSVLNQDYTSWECLVVDDGSTDKTQEVVLGYIQKDSRIKLLHRPNDWIKGANSCRNYGLENCNGFFVNWLDSDDVLDKNHLKIHIEKHTEFNVQATVSNAKVFFSQPNDSNQYWSLNYKTEDLITDMTSSVVSWQTAAVLWKKESLYSKPFKEVLSSSQEWTFHLERVINHLSYHVFFDTTVYIRRHEERIGKDFSPKKFKSTVLSRYYIYKILNQKNRLTKNRELELLHRIFQSIKKTIQNKYDSLLWFQIRCLITLIFISTFKIRILKLLIVALPVYRFLGKGEKYFSLKQRNDE